VFVAELGRPILPWALKLLIDGVALRESLFEHLPGLPKQSWWGCISEVDPEAEFRS